MNFYEYGRVIAPCLYMSFTLLNVTYVFTYVYMRYTY